jgi:hypothetical protein
VRCESTTARAMMCAMMCVAETVQGLGGRGVGLAGNTQQQFTLGWRGVRNKGDANRKGDVRANASIHPQDVN